MIKGSSSFSAICFLCIIAVLSFFPAISFSFLLPDTGQTLCYDTNGNVIDCAGTGQDGAYTINPMSFTDNGDGTVTDNNTGLIWQREDDGITHNWYQASGTYDAMYNPSSENVCRSLVLGGHSDWQLPTEKELMSIVNYSISFPGPTIDPIFTRTKATNYWASTASTLWPDNAWSVDFSYGYVSSRYLNKNIIKYVRCVRSRQYPKQNFVDNNDGTVTDNATGLTWQQGKPSSMTWNSALSYCKDLSLGRHTDWRLPNIKELESLMDNTKYPTIDTNFFPNANVDLYWSSSTHAYIPGAAWLVSPYDGGLNYYYPKYRTGLHVRCVRGGSAVNTLGLTVTVNPEEGGIIGSSPAGLNCFENICQGSFSQGTSITLTANSNGGWKFDYWDDGTTCYSENPLTVTMNSDKTFTANFSWSEKILLKAVDATPLGKRTPLILVHGNSMESKKKLGWGNYLGRFKEDSAFKRRYKVYLLSWDSEQSNVYNGMAMGYLIDSLVELDNKDITVLAHSRGGIIARYFMNRYTMKRGGREGQLGGEKVKWLITLATPHRGSPGADPIWVEISFDFNFSYPVALILTDIYFTELPWIGYSGLWDPESHPYLLWDDTDNILTTEEVCFNSPLNFENEECTPLMSKGSNDLSILNNNDYYRDKIIAYGSNNYTQNTSDKVLYWIYALLDLQDQTLENWTDHRKLTFATYLLSTMPLIPSGYDRVPGKPRRPFKANDGLVPLVSSLFLEPNALNLFKFSRNRLIYDKEKLISLCQISECNIVNGTFDHLEFLDNGTFIFSITEKLKSLK